MGKKDKGKSVSGSGGSGGAGVGKNGKEGKVGKPVGISGVPNRDIMQRMNFLWQASVYFERLGSGGGDSRGGAGAGASTTSGGGRGGEVTHEKKKRRGPRRTKEVDGRDLARMYVRTMNVVGQRTTTKMDPGVKRTICRGCSGILIPGISARIRNRPSRQHEHWMIYTCLKCGTSRRIPAPRNNAIDSPHSPEVELQIGATTAENIEAPAERLGEEQQRLVQSSNPPHSHRVQQQQSQRHSGGKDHPEEYGGDKKGITNEVVMDVPGDQRDQSERNIVVPHEKTGSMSKQKKIRSRKKKKVSAVLPLAPIPHQPPLFARKDAGHVVYRGGEIIDMEGVYCV